MKVLLLNAPPRAGKNTLARMIAAVHPSCAVIGFSHHLKRMVHGVYLGREGWDLDPDAFDAIKGEPQECLGGMSWRQAYIHYSENVIKPLHGKEWFGEMFLRAARASGAALVVVPDSGFREEAERVVREVGADCVHLVRMARKGCSYAGDSRSYISLADLWVAERDVVNPEGRADMMAPIVRDVLDWSA